MCTVQLAGIPNEILSPGTTLVLFTVIEKLNIPDSLTVHSDLLISGIK